MSEWAIDVDDADFDTQVRQSATPVLVDFWGEWCAPCKAMAPMLDQLAREYAGKVNVWSRWTWASTRRLRWPGMCARRRHCCCSRMARCCPRKWAWCPDRTWRACWTARLNKADAGG